MADSAEESTPRRNPKRQCVRHISRKYEDYVVDNSRSSDESVEIIDEQDSEDTDDTDFTPRFCSTPEKGQRSHSPLPCNFGRRNPPISTPGSSRKTCTKFDVEPYDPANDVFLHSPISVSFNTDSLRKDIKYLMESSGVPDYKSVMENSVKKKQAKSPSHKRKSPNTTPKRKSKQPEVELSSDDEPIDIVPYYALKPTPPSKLRAMIYTRDIIIGGLERKGLLAQEAMKQREMARAASGQVTRVPESEILKGVVAFVDVIYYSDENISAAIGKKLRSLGADVVPTFTKNYPVSIVVFNDGHVSTYRKAKKREVPLVSVLWIEESIKTGTRAPVTRFPPSNMERYESPEIVKTLMKRKFLYGTARVVPRKQRKRKRDKENQPIENSEIPTPDTSDVTKGNDDIRGPPWLRAIPGSDAGMSMLVNMTGTTEEEFRAMMEVPLDSDKYEFSPLSIRLLHQCARKIKESPDDNTPGEKVTNDTLENDSEENIEPDEGIGTSTCEESPMTPKIIEIDAVVAEQLEEEESKPDKRHTRYSKRLRDVRKKLSYSE